MRDSGTQQSSSEARGRLTLSARSRTFLLLVCVGLVLVALDLTRPAGKQWTGQVLIASIDLYQATLSRAFGAMGANCRFEPTCSHYGQAAIEHYGAWQGSIRSVRRILRCNPWTEDGTWDPPYAGWSEDSASVDSSSTSSQ